MSNVTEVTDETFQAEVIEAGIPVLVDFWAPWCGPCRAVAPQVEKVAEAYEGRAKVVKVNVDENTGYWGAVRKATGVSGIPALVIFDGETIVDLQLGAHPQIGQILSAKLDAAIAAHGAPEQSGPEGPGL
jgi:thioredoxin 1